MPESSADPSQPTAVVRPRRAAQYPQLAPGTSYAAGPGSRSGWICLHTPGGPLVGKAQHFQVTASDGLIARTNGSWAGDKLTFIDEYLPPALRAARGKRTRVYVDLFAGPGLNVDPHLKWREFEGAALRALASADSPETGIAFTHAYLVNKDRRQREALRMRTERLQSAGRCRVPHGRIHLVQGDANLVVSQILARVHPRAYLFVFADIESPSQLPWSTVAELKHQGHGSIDFYVLFPLEMAVARLISYRGDPEKYHGVLTRFFGTDAWRELVRRRITKADAPELRRGLEELYLSRLRTIWRYAKVMRDIRRVGRHRLYKMILATDNEAATRLGDWQAQREAQRQSGGQFEIGFGG